VRELSRQADEGVHGTKEPASPIDDDKVEDIIPPRLEAEKAIRRDDTTSSSSATAPIEKDFGTLVICEEGSRYVNHNFWVRVTEEVNLPSLLIYV
jgi:hypothetical protein